MLTVMCPNDLGELDNKLHTLRIIEGLREDQSVEIHLWSCSRVPVQRTFIRLAVLAFGRVHDIEGKSMDLFVFVVDVNRKTTEKSRNTFNVERRRSGTRLEIRKGDSHGVAVESRGGLVGLVVISRRAYIAYPLIV